MTPFENQLNNQKERNIFTNLEISSRIIKTKDCASRVFDSVLESHPEAKDFSWFEPLRMGLLDFIDTYEQQFSISSYISSVETRYIGSFTSLLRKSEVKGLSEFTEDELRQPHMQWLKFLDRKYRHYRESFPELSAMNCVTMARYHHINVLTDEEIKSLLQEFTSPDCLYSGGMVFSDWASWYESSKEKLDTSDKPKILPKHSDCMFKTLIAWKDQSKEENIEWLCRNYEIHPFHESIVSEWIDESKMRPEFLNS